MKRYRVKVRNSKECRTSITFADLSIHYTNGYSPALKVWEGDEVPLDLCEPEDVNKSFKAGTLKAYLNNGWLEEIPEEQQVIQSNFDEAQLLQVKTDLLTQTIPPQVVQPKSKEEIKILEPQSTPLNSNVPITDLNKVFSYDDFCKLSHFLKLRFIKESSNIDLLKQILSLTPSSQFKNNISLRLSNLQVK
jgi:hypothetical protein